MLKNTHISGGLRVKAKDNMVKIKAGGDEGWTVLEQVSAWQTPNAEISQYFNKLSSSSRD
jgi:hypothetical protein